MRGWQPHELVPELETLRLDDPNRISLKGRRRVRAKAAGPQSLRDWPVERRALLVEWLKRSRAESPRWQVLLEWANPRVQLAVDTLLGLLLRGWVETEEVKGQQTRGVWQPVQVHWCDLDGLRAELGLADPEAQRQQRENARRFWAEDERLLPLEAALAEAPAQTVLARRVLADALAIWLREQRSGTRRDFAQKVRGATKAVSQAEWRWLAQVVDLAACGIHEHQPLFYLGGCGQLLQCGQTLCRVDWLAGHLALTPASLYALNGVTEVHVLRVIENLTSFERRAAMKVPGELVVWLPGYAAPWWLDAFSALVRLTSAQVFIACDCDPWGIELALHAGKVVSSAGGRWQPWLMAAETLRRCKILRPLSEADRRKLDQLLTGDLLTELRELAQAQYDLSAKAEQEQYL